MEGGTASSQLLLPQLSAQAQRRWWSLGCCRRRRDGIPVGGTGAQQHVVLQEPQDASLVAEWKIVESSIEKQEFIRLQEFREAVVCSGLDAHPACAAVPHSQRAATLLRYLRARNGDVQKATALLSGALNWRNDFQIDTKLAAWREEWDAGISARVQLLRKYDFVGCLGRDREGLPVYVHRCSQGDPGGLARELGEDVLLLHLLNTIEGAFAEAQERMLRTGRLVTNFVEVYDVGNYGLVPRWLPRAMAAVKPFKNYTQIYDAVYPERIRTSFILRAPQAFSVIWRIARPMVPEATRAKIRIKGFQASTWIAELEELLPEASIPAWLREDDPANFPGVKPWGGIVPEGALKKLP